MIKAFKNIAAGLMMTMLIVVSSGFTLFSHICLMGGDREISSKQIVTCCPDENQMTGNALRSDCCDDHVQFIKFNFTSVTTQYQLHHQFISAVMFQSFRNADDLEINYSSLSFNNLPPPKSGREILSSKQVFRI